MYINVEYYPFGLNLMWFDFTDEEGLDEIRFAAYRTAAKLLFIQNKTNCKLLKIQCVFQSLIGGGNVYFLKTSGVGGSIPPCK